MANPKVRPHLSFYPEDSGQRLSEARQAQRWLHELPSEQTTPMARIGDSDYFIHEPAMLRDGICCMPIRWFHRGGRLVAQCWELQAVATNEISGWRVIQRECYEVLETNFLKNFIELKADACSIYNLPSPTILLGSISPFHATHLC